MGQVMTKTMLSKEESEKLIKFYGSEAKAEAALHSHAKDLIMICPRCHKVDINVLTHPNKCDPAGEADRRQSQESYWK